MKNYDSKRVIGLMSGTSLDGLDLVDAQFFYEKEKWHFEIHKSKTVPYPFELLQKLKKAASLTAEQLQILNVELGKWFADIVNDFKNNQNIDFIASHGHTVFHQPENGFTLQIGDGYTLHAYTQLPVICDFRSLDVALGGQGAPLVPIGDQWLFSDFGYCLNLGGIANISFEEDGKRIAYDIVPCNMILNHLANKLGFDYDQDGLIAEKGEAIMPLLDKWRQFDFYSKKPPKSLGYEWVSKQYFNDLDNPDYAVKDLMQTAIIHIVEEISHALKSPITGDKLLVTGGGTKNKFLISLLNKALANKVELVVPDTTIIDYKEALIFAFLGVLKYYGLPNCLASVTGAKANSSSGILIGF